MNATTMEDVEMMAYLLLGVFFFVRVGDHGVYYCVATSLAEAGFKKMSVSIFMNEMLS